MSLLVVFEGIDGCGKGTQISLLRESIERRGWGDRALITKQPGGTQLGDEVRRLLFDTVTTRGMQSDTCSLLYLISHIELVNKVVKPALADGKIVISDRWDSFSAVAFGKHGLEPPASQFAIDAHRSMWQIQPDLIFLLHGDPAVFLERANSRADKHQSGKRWANVKDLTAIQHCYFDLMGDLRFEANPPIVKFVQADDASAEIIFRERIEPLFVSVAARRLA